MAVAQFDAISGDLNHNIACHLALMEEAAKQKAAVVLFPELSITGYCSNLLDLDAAALAVDPRGRALADLRAACAYFNMAVIIGAPVKSPDGLHLASIVIARSGEIAAIYNKMYLDPDERGWFDAGDQPQQITIDGWNMGLGICYDSSFPEHARGYALAGADVYLLSGAFPRGRSDFRRTIYFPARSLENTIYLAFANYVGGHDDMTYGGMSGFYGPDGQAICDAGTEKSGIAILDVDEQHLRETREDLQMLRDCV
jgi:predicted amidohydrolase